MRPAELARLAGHFDTARLSPGDIRVAPLLIQRRKVVYLRQATAKLNVIRRFYMTLNVYYMLGHHGACKRRISALQGF